MPTTKEVMDQMSEGWGLADKIEEMRGKFQLKRKDREAYQDSTTKDIRNNEKLIAFLRKDNRKKRIDIAQHENGDERVIKTVFEDEREERLGLQRDTAAEAIEAMDQKVCETEKLLNNLRYERESAEKKLEELASEHECMIYLEHKSPEQLQAEQSTTQLENVLDKALIKYDLARIITKRYMEILDRLKDDSLTLPSRLEAMEQALLAQKQELRELKEMAKEAMRLRDEAKRQLCQVEMESIEARRQRELELTNLRKEVERRKIDTDKSDKKSFKASLLNDQQDVKVLAEQQQHRERQKKMLTYEEALQRIKEMTHVTDVADVVQRVLTQSETKSKLKDRVSELEGQTNQLKDENEKLRMQYHDLKYSGNRKLSKGQQLLKKTHDHLCKEGRRSERITDNLKRGGMTMVEVKIGTATLLEKLSDIKLPPPHFNYVKDGDIFDQMEICKNKVDQLMKEVECKKELQQLSAEGIVTTEFQDFLESQLPLDNPRITAMASETNISDFGFESQENEVLSRSDIKNLCQRMIDSKEKKTKKKKIKKK